MTDPSQSLDPREFYVTGDDLRALANAFYTPGDDRLEPVGTSYADRVLAGRIRSRVRDLADALDHAPPLPPLEPIEPEPDPEVAEPDWWPKASATPEYTTLINPHPDPLPNPGPPPWLSQPQERQTS
jgi:hypothetical protein